MPSKTRAVPAPDAEPNDTELSDTAPDPDAYVLLDYTGDPFVINPYGELRAGDVVAARPHLVPGLLAGGSFAVRSDPRPDAEQIRTP